MRGGGEGRTPHTGHHNFFFYQTSNNNLVSGRHGLRGGGRTTQARSVTCKARMRITFTKAGALLAAVVAVAAAVAGRAGGGCRGVHLPASHRLDPYFPKPALVLAIQTYCTGPGHRRRTTSRLTPSLQKPLALLSKVGEMVMVCINSE